MRQRQGGLGAHAYHSQYGKKGIFVKRRKRRAWITRRKGESAVLLACGLITSKYEKPVYKQGIKLGVKAVGPG